MIWRIVASDAAKVLSVLPFGPSFWFFFYHPSHIRCCVTIAEPQHVQTTGSKTALPFRQMHFPIFHHTCCNIRHKHKLSIQPNHVGIKMDGNARRSTVGARHSKRTPSSYKTWKRMKTTMTHWRPDVRIMACYAGLTRCGSRRGVSLIAWVANSILDPLTHFVRLVASCCIYFYCRVLDCSWHGLCFNLAIVGPTSKLSRMAVSVWHNHSMPCYMISHPLIDRRVLDGEGVGMYQCTKLNHLKQHW